MTGVVSRDSDVAAESLGFGFAEKLEGGSVCEIEGGVAIEQFAVSYFRAVVPPVVPVGFMQLQQVDRVATQQAEVFAQLDVHRFDRAEVSGGLEMPDLGGDEVACVAMFHEGVAEDRLRRSGAIEW